MRLKTIWTLRGMDLRERLTRTREAAARFIASKLPEEVAYWSLIHTGVDHIRPNEEVPAVLFVTVLDRAGRALR